MAVVMRSAALAVAATLLMTACAVEVDGVGAEDDDNDQDILLADPDLPDRALFSVGTTVGDVARTACSTAGVRPLAEQLLAEVNCLRPGTLTSIAEIPGVSLGAGALPQLNASAATALRNATNGSAISISSATRATAQQYVLYYWYQHGRCTSVVSLAAAPGRSNHESGLALDVPSYSAWKARLQAKGWHWLGSSDVVHFDYQGAGAVDLRPLAVKSFQRLWNRNNPSDRIAEDGVWGAASASRMDRSPASGFPIGPSCGGPSTPTPTTATLAGTIFEGSDTTQRVAGATVTVGTRTATTVADGSYRLDGLPSGTVTVTVSASGFRTVSTQVNLATGTANSANISVTRASAATALLMGVVYRGTDSGDRIAGATITLSTGQTTTTSATGVYTLPAVALGPVTITASKSGFTTRSVTRTIEANVENWGSVSLD